MSSLSQQSLKTHALTEADGGCSEAVLGAVRRTLQLEYLLLALLTSAFAVVTGSGLALALLHFRLQLESTGLLWTGALTAVTVSACHRPGCCVA